MDTPASSRASGPWSPLAIREFRLVWIAILVTNTGTWVHDVAAAWVMAEQTGSPLMVAAVQSATTLPVAILGLAAGTLADIVDRRRYLIAVQVWMMAVATALGVAAAMDALSPALLLGLTFALGSGAAMAMPAQAAITSELVPREQLAPAVALHSIGVNISRSIGPALGGLVVASLGAAWAFGSNALSFVGLVAALWLWRRVPVVSSLPPERFGIALRAGVRYAMHAPVFRSVLAKAIAFFVFASATTALLPMVVRERLAAGPGTFGVLLGFIGLGAIAGGLALPRLRSRFNRDQLIFAAALVVCAGTVLLAMTNILAVLCVAMLANGIGWVTVVSSLQIAAQTSVPGWVRARALSIYLMVFSLSMALGSLLWGALATRIGISGALLAAGACLVASSLVARRYRVATAESLDLRPSGHWAPPGLSSDAGVSDDRGPVMVTVEYRVAAGDLPDFLSVIRALGRTRRRDGAVHWEVMQDTAAPQILIEYFLLPSWLDHLRQHERVTHEERALQQKLLALHLGDAPPLVRHYLPPGPPPAAHPPHPEHALT